MLLPILFEIQNKILNHLFFQKQKEFLCLSIPNYDTKYYCMNQEQLKEYNESQLDEIKKLQKELNLKTLEEAIKEWSSSERSQNFRINYHFKKYLSLY